MLNILVFLIYKYVIIFKILLQVTKQIKVIVLTEISVYLYANKIFFSTQNLKKNL